jgi:hypothetical protein
MDKGGGAIKIKRKCKRKDIEKLCTKVIRKESVHNMCCKKKEEQ